jgi:hypothetical protein
VHGELPFSNGVRDGDSQGPESVAGQPKACAIATSRNGPMRVSTDGTGSACDSRIKFLKYFQALRLESLISSVDRGTATTGGPRQGYLSLPPRPGAVELVPSSDRICTGHLDSGTGWVELSAARDQDHQDAATPGINGLRK